MITDEFLEHVHQLPPQLRLLLHQPFHFLRGGQVRHHMVSVARPVQHYSVLQAHNKTIQGCCWANIGVGCQVLYCVASDQIWVGRQGPETLIKDVMVAAEGAEGNIELGGGIESVLHHGWFYGDLG